MAPRLPYFSQMTGNLGDKAVLANLVVVVVVVAVVVTVVDAMVLLLTCAD